MTALGERLRVLAQRLEGIGQPSYIMDCLTAADILQKQTAELDRLRRVIASIMGRGGHDWFAAAQAMFGPVNQVDQGAMDALRGLYDDVVKPLEATVPVGIVLHRGKDADIRTFLIADKDGIALWSRGMGDVTVQRVIMAQVGPSGEPL